MTQANVTAKSQFTFRVDFPDTESELFVKCSTDELPSRLTELNEHLNSLTIQEAPMIIEIRRLA